MPRKILFIEDEKDFAKIVAQYLGKQGFVVKNIFSGKEGLRELEKAFYDLVILDLGLPDEDGLKLCQKIRNGSDIPILILTARDEAEDKVTGLNSGADDYLTKPASLKELTARIDRLLNRDLEGKFRSSVFGFGGIKFDTANGTLASKRKAIPLTKKERAVLEYLVLRKGQILTRMEIMDHVWGNEIDLLSNTVNMVISSLRRKLRKLSADNFIHSAHGLGYKFGTNQDG